MTVYKIKQQIEFECDTCGTYNQSGTSDFEEAWLRAQADGWETYVGDGKEQKHRCLKCRRTTQ